MDSSFLSVSKTASSLYLGSSLLFTFEINELDKSHYMKRTGVGASSSHKIQLNRLPTSAFCRRLISDVCALLESTGSSADLLTAVKCLASLGYELRLRTALGSNCRGVSCFDSLRHEFLLIKDPDDGDVVVDLHFRDQFEVSHPTAAYKDALAAVPEFFVGPLSRLTPLVEALCSEMAACFTANGLPLPPWRSNKSMLSKWIPNRFEDMAYIHLNRGADPMDHKDDDDILGPPLLVTPVSSPPGTSNLNPLSTRLSLSSRPDQSFKTDRSVTRFAIKTGFSVTVPTN